MNNQIIKKLSEIKAKYSDEGFIIIGIFGSYARGEEKENSDLDILYEITPAFLDHYGGFGSIKRIQEINTEIKNILHKEIDLANKSALSIIGKKYILPEVQYV